MALQGSVNLTKNFKVRKPSCDIARGFACCPSLDNKAPSYLPALSSVREPWKLLFESRTPIRRWPLKNGSPIEGSHTNSYLTFVGKEGRIDRSKWDKCTLRWVSWDDYANHQSDADLTVEDHLDRIGLVVIVGGIAV